FFRQLYPHIDGVHRAGGVGNGALGVLAGLANSLDRTIHVAGIVHGIENTEHVYTVFGGTLTETVNHIIRIVTIAQQILAAQKHLLLSVRHGFFQFADALPRVFAQVTNTGVKGSPTPGFQRPETHFVEFLGDWQHVVQTHAGGEQGLVGVTQNYVRNPQRFFRVSHRVSLLLKGSNRVPGSLLVAWPVLCNRLLDGLGGARVNRRGRPRLGTWRSGRGCRLWRRKPQDDFGHQAGREYQNNQEHEHEAHAGNHQVYGL